MTAVVAWLPDKVLPLLSTGDAVYIKPIFGMLTLAFIVIDGLLQFLIEG